MYIGDSKTYFMNSFNYNKYLFDEVSYNNIQNYIVNNDYKVVKGKNIYLNQLISNSDVIILNANNFEYNNKCKKNKRIISEYDKILFYDLEKLVNLINRISSAKVYVIGNYCFNNIYIQNYTNEKYVYIKYENIENINKIIRKTLYN